jgi:acetyl esterase/lipase
LSSAAVIVPVTLVSLVVSEFPLHVLVAHGVSVSASIRRGGLRTWRGRVGLLIASAAWVQLILLRRTASGTAGVLDEALRVGVGTHYERGLPDNVMVEPEFSFRDVWAPRFSERSRYLAHRDLSYGDAGVRNQLDIWRRGDLDLDGGAPVLIQIHGSAWVAGSKRGQGYPLMAYLAERGWVCVAINYSLAPAARWPAHVIDVKRAIAWVRREISSHGGDPGFIAVTGGSAGGHLSALAALTANDPRFQPGFEDADTTVQAAVPLYGVYDLLDRAGDSPPQQEEFLTKVVIGASRTVAPEIWDQGSPLSHVRSDAPPMFVIHGDIDTFTRPEQARAFAGALAVESSNPVVFAELPGAQHAFDVMPWVRTAATVRAIGKFLTYAHRAARAGADDTTSASPAP